MNEEILRIQKMVAEGKITPEDGAELIETVRAGRPPTEVPVESATRPPPRFSRKAIIGAAWAPFFFIAVFLGVGVHTQAVTQPGAPPPGPAWWQYLLMFTLLPLGLAAPFGTTTLGAIALSQIRRSGGRLCGLALALFDVLLFPLLTVDVAIFYAFESGSLVGVIFGRWALACIIALVVDGLVIWLAWRAATKPVKGISI